MAFLLRFFCDNAILVKIIEGIKMVNLTKSTLSKKENLNAFIKHNAQSIIPLLSRVLSLDSHCDYILKDAYAEISNQFVICDKRPHKYGVLGAFTAIYDKATTSVLLTLGKCDIVFFEDFENNSDNINYQVSLRISLWVKPVHWSLEFFSNHKKVSDSMEFIFNGAGTTALCHFNKRSKKYSSSDLSFISSSTFTDKKFILHVYEFVKLFFNKPDIFKIYSISDVIDAFPNKEYIQDMDLVVEMARI